MEDCIKRITEKLAENDLRLDILESERWTQKTDVNEKQIKKLIKQNLLLVKARNKISDVIDLEDLMLNK